MDYSQLLQFMPLLQQQQAQFAANQQYAQMFQQMQQAQQQQAAAAKHAASAAAAPAAAASSSSSAAVAPPSPSSSPMPRDRLDGITHPAEAIPTINHLSPANVALTSVIESDWRWGSVCLFFEHFLPLFPNRKTQFKPELLLQAFMCRHHSCVDHKWDACHCPHPACQQLAGLLMQLMLMLHPIPEGSKKLPKNLLNITNYLPLLQQLIEKAYWTQTGTGMREQLQEIMELLLDDIASSKAAGKEATEEKASSSSSSSSSAAAASSAGKDSKSASQSPKVAISPPGSALLASHLHQLPPLCKLYLLHFVCDYVLGEVDILKECCTHSNLLAHGLAPAAAADAEDAASMIIAPNPFHNHGLSVPHARGDDGVHYWCFVHDEMSRVHLWRDVQTGAKDEFHVRLRKKGSTAPIKPPMVHGNEADNASDDDDVDLADEDDLEPIDAAHAQPTFNFSLIATDVDSVSALVSVWALSWKSAQGLLFLHKLQNEVLPAALIMQKKAERLARRDKTARTAGGLIVPDFGGASAQRWSSRTRKQVNYSEMDSGHDQEPVYREDSEEDEGEAQPVHHTKRTRRNAALTPLPDEEQPPAASGSGRQSAGHTQPASAASANTHAMMLPAVASPPAPAAVSPAVAPLAQSASSVSQFPNGSPDAASASMQESMLAAMYWNAQQQTMQHAMQQQQAIAQAQAQAAAAATAAAAAAAAAQFVQPQQAPAPMQDASMAAVTAPVAAPVDSAPSAMETDATPAAAAAAEAVTAAQ